MHLLKSSSIIYVEVQRNPGGSRAPLSCPEFSDSSPELLEGRPTDFLSWFTLWTPPTPWVFVSATTRAMFCLSKIDHWPETCPGVTCTYRYPYDQTWCSLCTSCSCNFSQTWKCWFRSRSFFLGQGFSGVFDYRKNAPFKLGSVEILSSFFIFWQIILQEEN